jgi:tetratricopeptide (TPR) repeat protein
LISQGKYLQALELLSSAPNRSDLYTYYYTSGTINQKIGKSRFAIQNFNQAIASTSERKDKEKALIALFKLYKSTEDHGSSQKTLLLIKGINPNYVPD